MEIQQRERKNQTKTLLVLYKIRKSRPLCLALENPIGYWVNGFFDIVHFEIDRG